MKYDMSHFNREEYDHYVQYFPDRTGSADHTDVGLPHVIGPFSLVATHLSDELVELVMETCTIIDALRQAREPLQETFLLPESDEKHPASLETYPCTFLQPLETPAHFATQRIILTGWDMRVCVLKTLHAVLATMPMQRTIAIHLPYGAIEDAKLENEGDTPGKRNILLTRVILAYLNTVTVIRGCSAALFDGKIIAVSGDEPLRTLLHWHSSTEKFLEMHT